MRINDANNNNNNNVIFLQNGAALFFSCICKHIQIYSYDAILLIYECFKCHQCITFKRYSDHS